jgi:murein DD-endopeptidase MepM/ murein hydrolase activator NlpD
MALLAAPAALAQSLRPNEILSSITVHPVSEPSPVLGADGRVHLAYEFIVVNPTRLFVRLDQVETVDDSGHSLSSREADGLAGMMTIYGGSDRMLSPGGSAVVFLDVSFGKAETLPKRISARVRAFRQIAGPDGKPAAMPADTPVPAAFSFTAAPTAIGKPAIVIEPPLRGSGWVAVNGCCDAITSHRGATMAVNGLLRVPERFAIDWIKLDADGRIFAGDGTKLSSYAYYGTPIHAAAAGTVVNLYDQADEQVPNQPARGITTENIGGNMVVIDMGGHAFTFYAHMQRGSLKVKLGDHVATGQVIGLLGNTGNSSAPHLHFHVMDGPSPLDANGLPYVFTHFTSKGVVSAGSDDALEHGTPVRIDPRLAGNHVRELPLNEEVVGFE